MTHLLDTDICSAHMKRPAGLAHRFTQYGGGLAISSVTLAELFAGAYKLVNPAKLLAGITDLLRDVVTLHFNSACAEQFGQIQGPHLRAGTPMPFADLMIASVALANDLTLVTHNTADYQNVPGLRLDDWLTP